MLYSLAYAILRLLLGNLMVSGRPNARLGAQVLALHHQLRVLERQVGRPRWQPRVHLAGCTYSPTGAWVIQQARNLAWKLQDRELGPKFLLRDRDSKFSGGFDNVFQSEGVEVIPLPYRSPRVNSFAERWVRTARREMVDHLLIFGRQHLERVLTEFLGHYHEARPHQGLGQRRPCQPPDVIPLQDGPVERRDRLGGLLHEYRRAASGGDAGGVNGTGC